jgi:hypothetical protein
VPLGYDEIRLDQGACRGPALGERCWSGAALGGRWPPRRSPLAGSRNLRPRLSRRPRGPQCHSATTRSALTRGPVVGPPWESGAGLERRRAVVGRPAVRS